VKNPPASAVKWRPVASSAIEALGYDRDRHAYVLYRRRGLYVYGDVSRQRVVAAASAPSVGAYINSKIIPYKSALRVLSRPEEDLRP
jgi:hypothetical protein